jgi:hypothetical protein
MYSFGLNGTFFIKRNADIMKSLLLDPGCSREELCSLVIH